MLTAILFGLAASSALVIGAVVGSLWDPPREVTGVLLAFASGALISALAFELFEEAYHLGGATRSGLALLAGAAAFVAADTWLDRRVTGKAGPEQREVTEAGAAQAAGGAQRTIGFALLAAVTLDGVPENLALGVSLVDDASLALLVAIFVSNLPESLVGAVAMRAGGQHMRSVVGTWFICARAARLCGGRRRARVACADADERRVRSRWRSASPAAPSSASLRRHRSCPRPSSAASRSPPSRARRPRCRSSPSVARRRAARPSRAGIARPSSA